jgi:4-amino-4-deoxy-L-arabinose transferase-like glycosyltransferase
MKKYFSLFVLVFILSLAFTVRTFHLQQVPAGFFGDEASIAYNAYSIMNTGKDEFGVAFPVFFQSFGDYKNPLFIYSAIPFIKVFGLTEFAIRLQSAVYGLIIILFIYLLAKEWFSRKAGLLAAFIAATMPWLLHYNRIGFELNMYVAFFTAAVYFFVKGAQNKHYLIPAFIISGFTLYTYQPPKLLVPLLIIGLGILYWKQWFKHWREVLIGFLCMALISIPLVLSFFNGQATARFNDVSIFSKELPIAQTAQLFLHNYFTQLNYTYFIQGEGTFITRHFINGLLPLLPVTIPFAVIGLFATIVTIKRKSSQVLLYWLLVYPIAGAVTAEPPFTGRSIIGAPLFVFLITFGMYVTITISKRFWYRVIMSTLLVSAVIVNFVFFLQFYFLQYPKQSSDFWGWQFGARDIVSYFVSHEDQYDELFMSSAFNGPEIFLKFYAPDDCGNCALGGLDAYNPDKKQLFAVTPEDIQKNPQFDYKPLHVIYYPDGKEAFIITTVTLK